MLSKFVKVSLIVAVVLAFSLNGAALAAGATEPQPAPDPAEQAARQLLMAKISMQAAVRLANSGLVTSEAMLIRLQTHLNYALHQAAQLPDEELAGVLAQVQGMLKTQTRLLAQARLHLDEPAQEPLRLAQQMLNRIQLRTQLGLNDPQAFRGQMGRYGPQLEPAGPPCSDECLPDGDEYQYGPQPEQPGPGAPGGNPDCTSDDCVPTGDQHQYGPQPEQPGPGLPGGNPDGSGNSSPIGDMNQNHNGSSSGSNGSGGGRP